MKTLYESILGSTKGGRQAFNVKPVPYGGTTWRIEAPMKEWFECVDVKTFLLALGNDIRIAKKYSKDLGGNRDFFRGLQFNDGYFDFRINVQSEYSNCAIYYYFYFADKKKNYGQSIKAIAHQMSIIDKVENDRQNDLNKRESDNISAQKMLDYIRRHMNIIEKQ